jgi:hypothetical protein
MTSPTIYKFCFIMLGNKGEIFLKCCHAALGFCFKSLSLYRAFIPAYIKARINYRFLICKYFCARSAFWEVLARYFYAANVRRGGAVIELHFHATLWVCNSIFPALPIQQITINISLSLLSRILCVCARNNFYYF